jgi:cyclin-dependent kinase-like
MNLIHRDIKLENILVDKQNKVKLCDFGFTRTFKSPKDQLTDYVATRWYRSPELLISAGYYGLEVDYWAVGCIMGELIDGDPLFPGDNEVDQLHVIQKVLGKLPDDQIEMFYKNPHFQGLKLIEVNKPQTIERRYMGKASKIAISFMKSLLTLDPKFRLKGDDVLNHPYFDDIREKRQKIISQTHREESKKEQPVILQPINQPQTTRQIPEEEKEIKLNKPKKITPSNINIINYNNGVINVNNNNNNNNTDNESQKQTKTNFKTFNITQQINYKKNLTSNLKHANTQKENMVFTSVNFKKSLNEDIKNLYPGNNYNFHSSFKTFYKGDKYSYDIGDLSTVKKVQTSRESEGDLKFGVNNKKKFKSDILAEQENARKNKHLILQGNFKPIMEEPYMVIGMPNFPSKSISPAKYLHNMNSYNNKNKFNSHLPSIIGTKATLRKFNIK